MLFIIRYIRPVYKKQIQIPSSRPGHRRTYRQVRSRCKPAGRCNNVKVCRSLSPSIVSNRYIAPRRGDLIIDYEWIWVHQLSPYMETDE
ncbi:MAG: hypothetical protein IPJ13_25520 [Saprospiraceae bacterium]|nr:hypothetical protein [Saprospiraceae bacterium]